MRKGDGHVTVTAREARAGDTSGHMRIILIVGTLLAIIGLFAILMIWSQG